MLSQVALLAWASLPFFVPVSSFKFVLPHAGDVVDLSVGSIEFAWTHDVYDAQSLDLWLVARSSFGVSSYYSLSKGDPTAEDQLTKPNTLLDSANIWEAVAMSAGSEFTESFRSSPDFLGSTGTFQVKGAPKAVSTYTLTSTIVPLSPTMTSSPTSRASYFLLAANPSQTSLSTAFIGTTIAPPPRKAVEIPSTKANMLNRTRFYGLIGGLGGGLPVFVWMIVTMGLAIKKYRQMKGVRLKAAESKGPKESSTHSDQETMPLRETDFSQDADAAQETDALQETDQIRTSEPLYDGKNTADTNIPAISAVSPDSEQNSQGDSALETDSIQQEKPDTKPAKKESSWKPGRWNRFPWKGFSALLVVLGCVGAAAGVLVGSNEVDTQNIWLVQPSVILSIISAILSAALQVLLGEAVVISWWRNALAGSNAGHLHRHWAHGTSVWSSLAAGGNFGFITMASLLVALSAVHSPFLQRATTVVAETRSRDLSLVLNISTVMPFRSGYITGRDNQADLYTPKFSNVVLDYIAQNPIKVVGTGCMANCTSSIQGIGMIPNCTIEKKPFDPMSNIFTLINGSLVLNPGNWQVDLFFTNFTYFSGQAASTGIDMNVTFVEVQTNEQNCTGTIKSQTCILQPAVVRYPIRIVNDTLSLSESSKAGLEVDNFLYTLDSDMEETIYGGISLWLSNTFNSNGTMRFSGARGWVKSLDGLSSLYFYRIPQNAKLFTECNVTFADPTSDIISGLNEVMLRLSLADSPWSQPQIVSARESYAAAVSQSHFEYLGAAIAFIAACMLAVVPHFWNYWQVGRTVSFSPIEMAKAFGALSLADVKGVSNAKANKLTRAVDNRELRYGVLRTVDGDGLLQVQALHNVEPPQAGAHYRG